MELARSVRRRMCVVDESNYGSVALLACSCGRKWQLSGVAKLSQGGGQLSKRRRSLGSPVKRAVGSERPIDLGDLSAGGTPRPVVRRVIGFSYSSACISVTVLAFFVLKVSK